MLNVSLNPLMEDPTDVEPCSLCCLPTQHWYDPKDVALCQSCAETAWDNDVPTKEAWFAQVLGTRLPRLPTPKAPKVMPPGCWIVVVEYQGKMVRLPATTYTKAKEEVKQYESKGYTAHIVEAVKGTA